MNTGTKKRLVTKQWIYTILGVAVWAVFLWCIPSNIDYPWNVLNALLGFLAPCLCLMALRTDVDYAPEFRSEGGRSAITKKTVMMKHWIYLSAGVVVWGVFLAHISLGMEKPSEMLNIVLGATFPYLMLKALIIGHKAELRPSPLGPLPRFTVKEWIYIVLGLAGAPFFPATPYSGLIHPWDKLHALLGIIAFWLWSCALALTMNHKGAQEYDANRQKTSPAGGADGSP